MRAFKQILEEAAETMKIYQSRNQKNQAMDAMANSEWNLPSQAKKEFFRKTVSAAPANALTTSVKVLGAETPKIKFTPTGPDPDDRATASAIERALGWEIKNAAKRSQTKLVPDIIRSAVQYAECAVYVDYLPDRIKNFPEARQKQILRNGNFALVPHNPSSVYPRYSPLGLESVLLAKMMKASQVVQYWGDQASKVKTFIQDEGDADCVQYDYTDHEQRTVWVSFDLKGVGDDDYLIMDEKRELGFIPWAIRMHGTSLETEAGLQRTPFLDTVYKAHMWEDMNLSGTLINSEVLGYAAAPRIMIIGPNGETVRVDYGDINKPLRIPAGHDAEPFPPPQIDVSLLQIHDRTKAELDAATSVQVLQNLNFPAGTAYATINAVLQTAIASLQPYKVLAEMTLADCCEIMLLWIDARDGQMTAYGTGKNEQGKQFSITKDDFSTTGLYIDVELNASAPTDFMQRINAGTLMLQLGYPLARVLEDLNVSDPEQAIAERYFEDMLREENQIISQQRQMEVQQQMQQAQMNMQNMMQGPPPSPGFSNVEGQGFDPNMGGTPPGVAASGLTREELNGVTSGGEPIAEV